MTAQNSPDTLYEYFLKHTDQDLHKVHHYYQAYSRYFSGLVGKAPKVLEIGVYRGGSLRMWKQYFGPGTKIIGVDINPECLKHAEADIEVLIGDQGSQEFLQAIIEKHGPFDIVIDDGSHQAKDQVNTFKKLYPHTRYVYLVEDTHTSYWKGHKNFWYPTFINFSKRLIDELNMYWRNGKLAQRRFGMRPEEREGEVKATEFCRTTTGIHFHDSLVFFEKGNHPEPWVEIR